MRSLVLFSAAAALIAASCLPAMAADVTVKDAWFRALPAHLPAGGYFQLQNNAASEAVLTGASSPACGMLMLHKSVETGGMGRMVHVDRIAVPAHGSVSFAPGGYHLMCMTPDEAKMKPGASVAVTLDFADGTRTAARFVVKNAMGQ